MKRHLLQGSALVFLILALFAADAGAQKRKTRAKPTRVPVTVRAEKPLPPDTQRRIASFDKVWDTINLFYYDKDFGGVNWSKTYLEFKPRVAAAQTDVQAHRILEEMIGRLGRSHLGVVPPEYYQALDAAKRSSQEREAAAAGTGDADEDDGHEEESEGLSKPVSRYGIGVEIRIIDGKVVITRVDEQSGAKLAGIRKGFVIERINGVSLKDLINEITFLNPSRRVVTQYLPMQITALFLNGKPDTNVLLTCLDEQDRSAEYRVPRLSLNGRAISIGTNYPEQFLQFESSSLSGEIGYIRFNVFGVQAVEQFCAAISEFRSKKAIVLDLRGNVGGLIGTIIGLTGMVTDKQMPIGTSVYRHGNEKLIANSFARNFRGKLAVLIDGQSMSSAEIFAAALREGSRALLIGERTAGEALPAGSVRLETGAVLIYPVANFLTPSGRALEGTGLEPDVSVRLTRPSIFGGADPQLAKAIQVINDEAAFSTLLAAAPDGGPLVRKGTSAGKAVDVGAAPPPPPAVAKPTTNEIKVTRIGSVTGAADASLTKDEAATRIMKEFGGKLTAGGKDIASYEVSGVAAVGRSGSEGTLALTAYRERPGKFMIALMSDAAGEVRTIYNGKTMATQTDYGADRETAVENDLERVELFAPVFFAADQERFKSLKFEGVHELEGRKVNVISGVAREGYAIGMSFDVETKLLSTFTFPGMMYTLGDYRSVDGIMVPFDLNFEPFMHVTLSSVKLNGKIAPAHFEKKERCFDKTN